MTRKKKLSSHLLRGVLFVCALTGWLLAQAQAQCPGIRPMFSWASNDSAITFIDQTAAMTDITDRIWYFGDGDSSYLATPTHVYDTAGVATVSLTFQSMGCSFSISTAVVHAGVNDDCSYDLSSAFDYSSLGNNYLQFTDASVADGVFVFHLWSFGDDSTSLDQSPDHFYIYPGAYDVSHSLGAVDSLFQTGCVAGTVERVFVDGNTSTCDSSLFLALDADEGMNPAPLYAQVVLFNDDLTITYWTFDFGDGTSSDFIASEHDYAYPGEYQLCVQVNAFDSVSNDSCFALACTSLLPQLVSVAEAPALADLRAWPVPFTEEIHITGPAVRRGSRWQLHDAMGRQVSSGTIMHDDQEQMTMPNLSPGIYVLRMDDGARSFALRLSKR